MVTEDREAMVVCEMRVVGDGSGVADELVEGAFALAQLASRNVDTRCLSLLSFRTGRLAECRPAVAASSHLHPPHALCFTLAESPWNSRKSPAPGMLFLGSSSLPST